MSQVTYAVDLSCVSDELRHEVFCDEDTRLDVLLAHHWNEESLAVQLANLLKQMNYLRAWSNYLGADLEDRVEDAMVMLLPSLAKLRELA